jgi:hypothetical protein
MEKWVRGLSQTTALILGIVSSIVVLAAAIFVYSTVSGLIPLILMGGILGGGVGFALPLVFKGITGRTPQERNEANKK